LLVYAGIYIVSLNISPPEAEQTYNFY